jgi:hypothetical protein
MRRKITQMIAAATVACGILLMATPASATTYPYDNTNPDAQHTNCAATGTAADPPRSTVLIYDPQISGDVLGYVELRWSTGCRTNWSRVTMNAGAPYAVPSAGIMTWTTRTDGASTRGHDGDPGPYHATSAYSDQLYGNNLTDCAWGQLAYQSINGGILWAQAGYCFCQPPIWGASRASGFGRHSHVRTRAT